MDNAFAIRLVTAISPDLEQLVERASDEGFGFMTRLIDHWHDGSNRFDRPGELYLGVWDGGRLIAGGGLNRDPYRPEPGIGRVRHVYVNPAARRSGAGTRLIKAIIDAARGPFSLLRLRTTTGRGAAFYQAIGFAPVSEPDASHVLML